MVFRTTGLDGCNDSHTESEKRSSKKVTPQHKKFEIGQLLPHRHSVIDLLRVAAVFCQYMFLQSGTGRDRKIQRSGNEWEVEIDPGDSEVYSWSKAGRVFPCEATHNCVSKTPDRTRLVSKLVYQHVCVERVSEVADADCLGLTEYLDEMVSTSTV